MHDDIERVLISHEAIAGRVREMGAALAERLRDGEPPLVVAVMQGCVMFLADLLRAMPLPLDLEFVYCSSYDGSRPAVLDFSHRASLPEEVRGRCVLAVDDIFDTGRTLAHVAAALRRLGAAEVTTAVLLEKRGVAPPEVARPDMVGFTIEDRFVVGYGLDFRGRYRNLPYIGVLRAELLT